MHTRLAVLKCSYGFPSKLATIQIFLSCSIALLHFLIILCASLITNQKWALIFHFIFHPYLNAKGTAIVLAQILTRVRKFVMEAWLAAASS